MTSASPTRTPEMTRFRHWLRDHRRLDFADYEALWTWSITDLDAFWQAIWDYFEIESPTPHEQVLVHRGMPGSHWFPGAQVNYARQVLRHVDAAHAAGMPAITSRDERGNDRTLDWPDLRAQVAALARHLRAQGVVPGDRVVAFLPNTPETVVAFLAAVSVGAVWSICAPDMGVPAILDRFRQIGPKVLIACDGVVNGGEERPLLDAVARLRAALPTLEHTLLHRILNTAGAPPDVADFVEVSQDARPEDAAFEPLWLPFEHPLWIVYSSGTTGLPKALVHGHGGVLMTMLATTRLHHDVGCSYAPESFGERFHWYSSTGWIMWNGQMAGLLGGTTCCLFDGSPSGLKNDPDWSTLWRFAADHRVSFFGAGAAFYAACAKVGLDLSACGDLSRVRALGSTGSPLADAARQWGDGQFRRLDEVATQQDDPAPGRPKPDQPPRGAATRAAAERGGDIWWCNISGGTDFAGAFVGGNRELPQVPGEIQCRLLGCAVEAYDDAGQPVVDQVGELVCLQPIPSMPLHLWGDQDNARYIASYFDVYPGVWRHGDWLKITHTGTCVIYGRSDATINRHGLRLGTSEIYNAVERLPDISDCMVVDLEYLGRPSEMILFVVLRDPAQGLDEDLRLRVRRAIREAVSPRFVPDTLVAAPAVPRTLSGKKQEVPIKRLLLGERLEAVINRDTMANPECLDWYVRYADTRKDLTVRLTPAEATGP